MPDADLMHRAEIAVDERLSGKRLAHVHNVADTAEKMAALYGVDISEARLAGLLHDWDKLLTDEELPARMDELGLERPDHIELLLPVLHSLTGAAAVKREFPEIPDGVVSAIRNHTLGSLDMSDLDIVVFVSDMTEPGRSVEKSPGIAEVRELVGNVPLDELYFAAYRQTMRSLVERRRFIHPAAFDIWNGLVQRHHPPDKSRQGDAAVVG